MAKAQQTPRISDYLAATKKTVDEALRTYLIDRTKETKKLGSSYKDLYREIEKLVARGGKRLRPALVLLAYQGFGGKKKAAILRVALSQELFHAFILMHDDVIDGDSERWGGDNIIGRYFSKFNRLLPAREALHYAESMALLAGDICQELAHELLLKSGFKEPILSRADAMYRQTLFTVIGGEVLDVSLSLDGQWPSEQTLLAMYGHKTAAYSFETPLKLGALLAGADKQNLRTIEAFATKLGIAYQLSDDLLNMFGDRKKVGKPLLTDLRAGKRTVLMVRAKRLANKPQQEILTRYLGNPDITEAEAKMVRDVLEQCGARTQTEKLAADYLQAAAALLPLAGFNKPTTRLLQELIDYLASRPS